ncbi:MAG: DUF1573 domain-containing protein [Planctomycetaceae bacterium]|nr:DUF1573 domain-containing protein [Planctomycetaceae bacterium]
MKINLLIVLMLLIFFSGCRSLQPISALVTCKQQCKLDMPRIVFVSTEHDFGKVDAGSQNTCTFEFINDGDKDLIIEETKWTQKLSNALWEIKHG